MSFFAKELQRYLNQDLYMTDITEKSYDKATEKLDWQVQAKHAQQLANQNLIHLYDGVNAIMITKNQQLILKRLLIMIQHQIRSI